MSLLMLADEQETMINRYIEEGIMYVLNDNGVKAECVLCDAGEGILEIKNLATDPESQRKGYGRRLIEFIAERYCGEYLILQVGTGDSPLTVPFYEKCGFVRHHVIKHFFRNHYDHPIIEDGVQLDDMVVLRKPLSGVHIVETGGIDRTVNPDTDGTESSQEDRINGKNLSKLSGVGPAKPSEGVY